MSSLNDMVVGRQSFADEGVGKRFPTYSRAPRKKLLRAPMCCVARCSESKFNPCTLRFLCSGRLALGALATVFRGAPTVATPWRAE
jgi:hypothetical protein